MRAGGRACSLLTAIIAFGPPAAGAQAIRGRLVEGAFDAPAVGALVTLQDFAGTNLVQAVSGSNGPFFLRAPGAGGFTLRVLRIGYPPWGVALQFADGEVVERSFTLSDQPVVLPDVQVEGRLLCGAYRALARQRGGVVAPLPVLHRPAGSKGGQHRESVRRPAAT